VALTLQDYKSRRSMPCARLEERMTLASMATKSFLFFPAHHFHASPLFKRFC
jgi:hypothetical protein